MVFSDTVHVSGGEAHELILEFHHKNGFVLIDLVTVIPYDLFRLQEGPGLQHIWGSRCLQICFVKKNIWFD